MSPAKFGFGSQRLLIASLFLPETVSFLPERSSGGNSEDGFDFEQSSSSILQQHVNDQSESAGIIAGLQQDVSKRPSSPASQSLAAELFPRSLNSTPGNSGTLKQPKSRAFLTPNGENHGQASNSTRIILPLEIPPQNSSRLAVDNENDEFVQSENINKSRRNSVESSEDFSTAPWSVVPTPQGNGGLYNAIKAVAHKIQDKLWFGTLGMPTDALSEETQQSIIRKFMTEYDSCPVIFDDHEFAGAYNHFCKQILWPTFHYVVPDQPKSKLFLDKSWKDYVQLNKKFADAIADAYKPGDIIWINDYHLLLLPRMLRELLPHAMIGFFLHIPFPSSEIFRCLPVRKQLLEGILGADMIGFQTYSFARHFLQTISRLMSYEATPNGIHLDNGFVAVGIFPIGIDIKSLNEKRTFSDVDECLQMLKERYEGKKLIVGRDKLDYVKGVRQKFLAFELFLERYPEWQGQAVLVQVALSTTEQNEIQGQVSDVVTRINSKYSTLAYQPIVFLHQDITFSQYIALLSAADACLITSLRDGMNLTSHEYVVCQETKHSPLILSEFTGTYGSFGACIRINPWDYIECAEAIQEALTMSDEEKLARWEELYSHVHFASAQYWTESFVDELVKVHTDHRRRHTLHIARLTNSYVQECVNDSSRRLFLFNYDGTLVNISNTPALFSSPQRIQNILANLAADPRNVVYVMSNRTRTDLDKIFSRIQGLGLCAENGCFIRPPNSHDWESLVTDMDLSWRKPVNDILQFYAERTPGSKVEEKQGALVFHYGDAEQPAYAAWQAAECSNHLSDSLGNHNFHVVQGNKTIEVLPKNVSKGQAVVTILRTEGGEDGFDFALAIGSDRFDEDMFSTIQKMSNQIKHTISAVVGARSSEAQFLLPGTMSVSSVLESLVKTCQKRRIGL